MRNGEWVLKYSTVKWREIFHEKASQLRLRMSRLTFKRIYQLVRNLTENQDYE